MMMDETPGTFRKSWYVTLPSSMTVRSETQSGTIRYHGRDLREKNNSIFSPNFHGGSYLISHFLCLRGGTAYSKILRS